MNAHYTSSAFLSDYNYTCTITQRTIDENEWHAYCYLEDYRIAWDIWAEWEGSK